MIGVLINNFLFLFYFYLFCPLLSYIFVSLRFPTKSMSTVDLYQVETKLCPIFMLSPGKI